MVAWVLAAGCSSCCCGGPDGGRSRRASSASCVTGLPGRLCRARQRRPRRRDRDAAEPRSGARRPRARLRRDDRRSAGACPRRSGSWARRRRRGRSRLARAAAMLIAAARLVGIVRLAVTAARGASWRRGAPRGRSVCQLGMVVLPAGRGLVLLPRRDAAAVGARGGRARRARRATGATRGESHAWRAVAGGARVVAALAARGCERAPGSARARAHGYVVLNPAALTLDGGGGRDAAVPGRLADGRREARARDRARGRAGVVCDALAVDARAGVRRCDRRQRVLARAASPPRRRAATGRARDALVSRRPGRAGRVGAGLRARRRSVRSCVARYAPTIAYDTCRDAQRTGRRARARRAAPTPLRRRHGRRVRRRLPVASTCTLAAGTGATRVVAAVTAGTVTLRDGAGTSGPSGRDEHALRATRRRADDVRDRDRAARRHAEPTSISTSAPIPTAPRAKLHRDFPPCYERADHVVRARPGRAHPRCPLRRGLLSRRQQRLSRRPDTRASTRAGSIGSRISPRGLAPGARWLDLGCAYGYLVAEARAGGFDARRRRRQRLRARARANARRRRRPAACCAASPTACRSPTPPSTS